MKQRKIGNLTELTAEKGYIHKLGTDSYVETIVMLPDESQNAYEEVEEIPPYTKAEYDAKVAELVREHYSVSEEFALQRKAINAAFSPANYSADNSALDAYAAYNTYIEQCKSRAKDPTLYAKEQDM